MGNSKSQIYNITLNILGVSNPIENVNADHRFHISSFSAPIIQMPVSLAIILYTKVARATIQKTVPCQQRIYVECLPILRLFQQQAAHLLHHPEECGKEHRHHRREYAGEEK